MFTWICPECGREVPPSYSECPDCAAKAAAKGTTSASQQAPPPAEVEAPRPAAAAAPPVTYVVVKGRLPGWLVAFAVAVAMIVVLGGAYYFLFPSLRSQPPEAPAAAASLETPTTPVATASAHPLAKHIEIAGLRITEEGKKTQVRFLVVNHSGAVLADLAGTLSLHASTAKPGSEPLCTVAFQLASVGPYDSKELTLPIKTSLRAYELPDWQFLRSEWQLTKP